MASSLLHVDQIDMFWQYVDKLLKNRHNPYFWHASPNLGKTLTELLGCQLGSRQFFLN